MIIAFSHYVKQSIYIIHLCELINRMWIIIKKVIKLFFIVFIRIFLKNKKLYTTYTQNVDIIM